MYSSANRLDEAGREQALNLEVEIAALEERLEEMGIDGDCAYERAMSKVYQGMLEQYRQQLAALQAACS